ERRSRAQPSAPRRPMWDQQVRGGGRSHVSFARRSTRVRKRPQPRQDALQGLQGPRFVLSFQVQQDMHAVAFFANDRPVVDEVTVKAKDLVVADRVRKASDVHRLLFLGQHDVFDQRIGLVREENGAQLGTRLLAGGQVHLVADDRIVHAVFAAEIAYGTIAGVDGHPYMKQSL